MVTLGDGCDEGETPAEAARREAFEEAGLVCRPISVPSYWPGGRPSRSTAYGASRPSVAGRLIQRRQPISSVSTTG